MSARAINFKDKIVKSIIELLFREGIIITKDNVKVWMCDTMMMRDVANGCNYVKSELDSDVVVYTNKVPNLEYLEKNERVRIFDQEKLQKLALAYKDYDLYDMLS